jgi:O-antigen/teichoic acid export membrane protein
VSSPAAAISARRATADVVVQIVARVLNVGLGLIVTALIARQLGATGFGQWSTIFALVQIAGYFADLKLQEVAIREIAAAPEREGEWLGALISLRVALGVPVALAAIVVLAIIARSREMRIAAAIVSVTLATSALSATGVVFRLRVRNDLTMAIVTVNSVAWGAAVVAITSVGGGMIPLAIAFTLCATFTATMLAALARRRAHIRLRGSVARWAPLVRVGAAVGLAGLLTLAYARIDQLIVYELAPHRTDAGLYAGIYRILDTGSFVPGAVMTTLFPLVAAAVPRDMDRARRLVQSALDYLAMVSLPVLAFSLVGAKPLLRFLLGADFVPAAGALPILMGAYVAICWGYVAGNMVIVLGLQRRFIRYAVVGLALNVALNLALVPSYGYRAAAWVTLVTELTVIGLSIRAVLGEMKLRPRLARLARVVAVAALLVAVLLALRSAGAGLAVLVGATAALYPALLVASRALDLAEVRALVAGRSVGGSLL